MPIATHYPADGRWYRAEIVDLHSNLECDVNFVDFGNTERLPLSYLKYLKTDYLKFSVDV
jgi:hypothetical protein